MSASSIEWTLQKHSRWPDKKIYLAQVDAQTAKRLKQPVKLLGCDRPCTRVIELLPPTSIEGHSGRGYAMVNVDGYRHLNCFLISDPLSDPGDRGFSLHISFAVGPFMTGVGWLGETWVFASAEQIRFTGQADQPVAWLTTSDLAAATGQVPYTGGSNLSQITRVPVMGPYVRATAINEGSQTRSARVVAYATT